MPATSPTYEAMKLAIAEAPISDTHDHLRPLKDLGSPMHLTRLFRNTYIARSLRAPDGSRNGIGSTWEVDLDHDRWEVVEAIVAKVQMTC